MMTIGEFALQTGLSVKTLRFYDERGLLPPAEVDPASGYRHYSVGQLRQALQIRVLRATGMSLEVVAQALAEPDRCADLLAAHRGRLAAERELQDRALGVAERLLKNSEQVPSVLTREVGPTHWAAVAVTVDPEDDAGQDPEWANTRFAQLWRALTDAGNAPVGPFWTGMGGASAASGAVELLLAWPVARPVPDDFGVPGVDVRHGTLPERTEAFVRVRLGDVETDLLDGDPGGPLPPPAYLAFAEFLEAHGAEPGEIRQVGVVGDDGAPIATDLTATIATRTAAGRPHSWANDRR